MTKNNFFGESFLESLPSDRAEAGKEICTTFRLLIDSNNFDYIEVIEAYALTEAFLEAHNIEFAPCKLTGSEDEDIETIKVSFRRLTNAFNLELTKSQLDKYRKKFGNVFCYEFSENELEDIQFFINDLRDLIVKCTGLENEHKARLLRRLENLQAELNKKVFDLDRFWGLIGDAGVVLGKLGTDAKPIVDRIKKITTIIWRVQIKVEHLPGGTPPLLLGTDESSHTAEKSK